MTSRVRVLVVDDAVVIRKAVATLLASDADVEVVGTANDGKAALAKVDELKPDVVVLDVHMPEMSGLQTLEALRDRPVRPPVIMLSSLTEDGADVTVRALALGAADYVTKPSYAGGLAGAFDELRRTLLPKVKALGLRGGRATAAARPAALRPSAPPAPLATRPSPAPSAPLELLAIGCSAGGPAALCEVFRRLPGDLPVPIVVTQHMPPVFTRLLAEQISNVSAVKLREAEQGAPLRRGEAWIAPGDFHMVIRKEADGARIDLHKGPPEHSCRPAVDPLFRSVAAAYGPRALAVVLTGMGQDGCSGARAIVDAGGCVLAQDEATSVVWGMPGFVVRAGLASAVLPLDRVADEIVMRLARGRDSETLRAAKAWARPTGGHGAG